MKYNKNDIVTVTIKDMGINGEGIGKVDGYPIFIKDAVIEDVVETRITKAKKQYAYGRVERVIMPSPFRITPPCSYAKQCGGCQIQALSYEKQLEYKQNIVKNNLVRIGGFPSEEIEKIMLKPIGMKAEDNNGNGAFRYRNKAQFPFGQDKEGNIITGFYASRSHNIISNTDCMLGVKENEEILTVILDYMKKANVLPYNEETKKGLIRHVLIRKGFSTGEIMVCIVINGKTLKNQELLVDNLLKIKGVCSISCSINEKNTNVIMGEEIIHLVGKETITDTIGTIKFDISPLSFYQINPIQTKRIYDTALSFAALEGNEIVWDLYCGIGTISLFLAQAAKKVYGVELIPEAISDAKKNAMANSLNNTEFYVGEAEEVLPRLYREEGIKADVIVVDPPRKGCDSACLETMLLMKPKRIVYVSCDSATLSRDLKILCETEYKLEKVQAFDNFPNTVHVETVVLLSHKNS